MRVQDWICRAGAVNNEDLIAFSEGYALVLDGATGLQKNIVTPFTGGKDQTDAQWLVRAFSELFQEYWDSADNLPEVVERCLAGLERQYHAFPLPGDRRELLYAPSASLGIVRQRGQAVELFMLGDCSAVVARQGETEEIRDLAVSRLDRQAIALMTGLAEEKGIPVYEASKLPQVLERLRENRTKKNAMHLPDGYAILSPQAGLSKYGIYRTFQARELAHLLVVTDGMAAYEQSYRLAGGPAAFLEAVRDRGFAPLLEEQRALEQADASCQRFPRFKVSDDASGVLLDFSQGRPL